MNDKIATARAKAASGERLTLEDALALYEDNDILFLAQCARKAKEKKSGRKVFYTVNRHINLTNICSANCPLCAFQVEDGDKRGFTLEHEDIDRILAIVPRITVLLSENDIRNLLLILGKTITGVRWNLRFFCRPEEKWKLLMNAIAKLP